MSHPKHDCKEAVEWFRLLLAHEIPRLPEQQRLVISLSYYEDLTFKEIANVLGMTETNVGEIHDHAVLRIWAELVKTWPARGAGAWRR